MNLKFKDWKLRWKLLVLSIGIPLVLCSTLLYFYAKNQQEETMGVFLDKSRVICKNAESIRETADEQWDTDIFNAKYLRDLMESGASKEKILQAIPIITAMKSTAKGQKEGGYKFKTPKYSPRNPQNEPDKMEARAIDYLRQNLDKDEYYEIDPTTNSIRYFKPVRLTSSCLVCHGDPAMSEELWGNSEGRDVLGYKMEGWKEGEIHGAFEIIQSLDEADSKIAGAISMAVSMVGGAFCLITVLSLFVSNRITKPIHRSVERMKSLAKGDLLESVELDQKDEIGELVNSMNYMSKELRDTISEIANNSDALEGSSTVLSASSSKITSNSEQVAQSSDMVAASGEELSATIMAMSQAANGISEKTTIVNSSVREMESTIKEISESCARESQVATEAQEKVKVTKDIMSQLEKSAIKIDSVLEIITSIANQTNLLSLNATIEAASAGESGKGFAVVANEIKELARQSSSSAEEISNLIKEIQHQTKNSAESIQVISSIIDDVTRESSSVASAVEEQSATTSNMTRLIKDVTDMTSELATNIKECATSANSVSENINEVSSASSASATTANETNEKAEELSQMAKNIKSMVNKFTFK